MTKLRTALLVATLGVSIHAAQLPVNLGTAANFTVLGASTVTNTGPTVVNGNVGVSPGSAITGFPPGVVSGGAIHVADGPAGLAQGDLTTAFNDAAGRPTPIIVAGDLGGLTLAPGLYKSTSTLGITGTVTLDGQGNPNAVFIFQIGSGLTTATSSQVSLIGGAQAANIFWQVGSSATLGTFSIFNGTIMAQASVSLATGAALNGRALARTGAVTLDFNSAVNPGPPTTGGPPAPLVVTCPLNSAQIGVAYTSLVTATGGTPPYTFSITGLLPAGLSLNASTGAVTGTPTGAGSTFTANATDSAVVSANNSCTITTSPAIQADLSIVKTGPATAIAGANITFNLAVANAGPNPASAVIVTDVLPSGTTFVSATPSVGTCSGTTTVTCSLGTMASGAAATVALVITGPAAAGSVANTAFVSSATLDPNAANNSSTATVAVGTQADLSIVKTGPAIVSSGGNVTYNLTVSNAGPNPATAVTVTDVLPSGTTFVSATPSAGTCSGTTTVTCALGTIANGANATVVLVIIAPTAAGSFTNTASVASTTPDPNAANNSSSAGVSVAGASVPALSTWGLGLLALMLAAYAVRAGRRANSRPIA